MKKILCLILAILTLTLCAVSCNDTTSTDAPSDQGNEQPEQNTPPHIAPKADQIDMSTLETLDGVEICEEQTDYVLIDIADYGKILIRLYPDVAPATVANFKKLVSQKFYDGLIFHRVIRNFMMQELTVIYSVMKRQIKNIIKNCILQIFLLITEWSVCIILRKSDFRQAVVLWSAHLIKQPNILQKI